MSETVTTTILDKFRDSHLYMGICLLLTAAGTALLVLHFISESSWIGLVEWLWASLVAGGIGSAYRK